jgi:Flp pilus assembly pilin Flp
VPILTDPATATGMEAVKTAMTTAVSFMTSAFDAMTANGYLVIFLAVTMIGVGVTVFRKLRRGA